ncbi:MAG: thioesterase family protein [Gammaproteobacteria bacterium]|nr:thioesterase family protein [Gammaproteobacteria bacterium]
MHKIRLLKILLQYLFGKRPSDPLRPVTCQFLITPLDVELTRAASHSYAMFANLGRWCWSFQNIDWNGLLKERWVPLTHSELIHYRRAIKLFTTVEVATTLIWWDDKMAYFEHRISQGETVFAVIYSRGTFFKGRERIPPMQCVVDLVGIQPPDQPAIVDFWISGAELFRK